MLTCMDIDLKQPGAAAAAVAATAGSFFGVVAAGAAVDRDSEFRLPISLMSALGASPSTLVVVGLAGPPLTAELERAKLRRGNLYALLLCLLFSWLEDTEGLTPAAGPLEGLGGSASAVGSRGLRLTELREELRENIPEMVFMKFFFPPAVLLDDLFPPLLLSSAEETMPSMYESISLLQLDSVGLARSLVSAGLLS